MKGSQLMAILVLLFLSTTLIAYGEVVSVPLGRDSQTENLGQLPLMNIYPESSGSTQLSVCFNRTFGGSGNDYFYSVTGTLDNGFLFVGGTNSIGSGGKDFWIVKTNALGQQQWAKTFGRSGNEEAHSVTETEDGGFAILGTTDSFGAGFNFWLVKIDSSGNSLWNRTYGGSSTDDGWSVVELPTGELILAGWTSSYGIGGGDMYLVKTDGNGNLLMSKTYGGPQPDAAFSVIEASGGDLIFGGYTYSFGSGGGDFLLVRTDTSLNQIWNRTYGGMGEDYCYSVTRTTDGNYAALGSTSSFGSGVYDFWLVKLDEAGNDLWSKTYGGPDYDEGWAVIPASGGDLACVGWTASFGSGKDDCWLFVTDAQGNVKMEKIWGGSNYDEAYSGILTSNKVYVLAGQTDSFGNGNYDSLLLGLGKLGDVNLDGNINVLDLILVAAALGTHPGDPKWNPSADVNKDGSINILDLIVVATHLGT